MAFLEIIGWTSGLLFAASGAPEAYRSWKHKRCYVGWGMISIWFSGEILATIYIITKTGFDFPPMIFNYISNICFITILIYYKIYGRPIKHLEKKLKEEKNLKRNIKIADKYKKKLNETQK